MSATASIPIDSRHARAICDEIGERLRMLLKRDLPKTLPPRLQELLDRLAAADDDVAPSIVPSLDDIAGFEVAGLAIAADVPTPA
jgi:hypothetical protein